MSPTDLSGGRGSEEGSPLMNRKIRAKKDFCHITFNLFTFSRSQENRTPPQKKSDNFIPENGFIFHFYLIVVEIHPFIISS